MALAARTLASALRSLEMKLGVHARLSAEDLQALRTYVADIRSHLIRSDLLEHDPNGVRLVVSGWVGLARTLTDGRRQILHLALPGDIVKATPTEGLVALTQASSTDARPLLECLEDKDGQPSLAAAWRLAEADQQRRLLDQIVRLGSLTAYERAANLIVELIRRHARAGLGDGRRIPWPITQEVAADILGLSIVHVNRVLQQLRRDRLIEIRAGSLVACDMDRLTDVGFAPSEAGQKSEAACQGSGLYAHGL